MAHLRVTIQKCYKTLQRLNNIYWTTQSGFPWATSIIPGEEIVCNDDETLIDGVCVKTN